MNIEKPLIFELLTLSLINIESSEVVSRNTSAEPNNSIAEQ